MPLLSSGAPSAITLRDAYGLVTLGCNVHGRVEAPSRLLVLGHPFFGWSDGAGRFRLTGVPSGQLRVAAIREDGSGGVAAIEVSPGAAGEARITLDRP